MPIPFFNRRKDFTNAEVLVLSKDDCSLCDTALEVVENVRSKHPFILTIVKIEPGDTWYDNYWDKIPVGFINGQRAFMYRTTEAEFLEALEGNFDS